VTGFAGEVESPLPTWLHIEPVGECEINDSNISNWSLDRKQKLYPELMPQEFKFVPYSDWSLQAKIGLSASSIERYLNCPFQYFAEKVLQLKDPVIADLDPDRRNTGSLSHAFLEKLTQQSKELTLKLDQIDELKNQLNNILEELKSNNYFSYIEDQIWFGIKKKLITVGIRFLNYENNWFKNYPQSKIHDTEVPFKIENNDFYLQGKIDRIDTDTNNNSVIIDYKSSIASLKNYSGWIEHRQLQMLI
jgi:ATP-dependent helicase/DNAse subunit B